MSIKPLGDRVVAIKEAAATKTASGILLGDSNAEKSNVATAESVGPDVKNVKKGDKIIFREYSATEVKLNSDEYLIIKEEDILATL